MTRITLQRLVLGLIFSFAATTIAQADGIEGTWHLIKRQLPDGTVLNSPAVVGHSTVGNGFRHTNVFWHMPDGKPAYFGIISKTKFTANEYTETLLASVFDDGSGKPIAYNFTSEAKSTSLTRDGGKISYKLPFDPPSLVYDGDKLTATFEGVFVDYWEKIK